MSIIAEVIGTAFGPGFMVPVVCLPSHFMMIVRSRFCLPTSYSPYHVPVSGCPSCAAIGAARAMTTRTNSARMRHLRNEEPCVVDLFLAAEHQLGPLVELLADVLEQLVTRSPAQCEVGRGPRLRVRTRVVDRRLILQRVHVGTRDSLGELQLRGVRRAARVHPELLVQSARFDDQRVAFPVADRIP